MRKQAVPIIGRPGVSRLCSPHCIPGRAQAMGTTRSKPAMHSGGSSSFWFTNEDPTRILAGNGNRCFRIVRLNPQHDRRCYMTVHVWQTPKRSGIGRWAPIGKQRRPWRKRSMSLALSGTARSCAGTWMASWCIRCKTPNGTAAVPDLRQRDDA